MKAVKKYVTPNDLNKICNIKGEILKDNGRICLVKTSDIFTVWNPEENFTFVNTFDENEAIEIYNKYAL